MSREFEPLPYYRWYWRDARASRRWQRMHHLARAIYRELLDECWAEGGIPDDAAKCADLIGWPLKTVEKHWTAVRPMFEDAGDGWLINERMENERTDVDRQRALQAINGRRGGQASGEARRSKTKQNEAPASGRRSPALKREASSSSKEQSNSSSSSAASRCDPETGSRSPQLIGEGPILRAFRAEGVLPPDKLVS